MRQLKAASEISNLHLFVLYNKSQDRLRDTRLWTSTETSVSYCEVRCFIFDGRATGINSRSTLQVTTKYDFTETKLLQRILVLCTFNSKSFIRLPGSTKLITHYWLICTLHGMAEKLRFDHLMYQLVRDVSRVWRTITKFSFRLQSPRFSSRFDPYTSE